MKPKARIFIGLITLALLGAASVCAQESGAVRRFGIFVGANDGGAERVRLRWAASDAYRLADVMHDVGGLDPRDAIVLVDPDAGRLEGEMQALRERITIAQGSSRRVELMFYYSGHSDEVGLMLGETHYGYDRLRRDIKDVGADVSIAILDSCASGAFTRLKGGSRIQPFLVDDATDMSGHAFLTSSSEDEASQESDAIGSSFFTHYIISGLRGGADSTQDGRVTLNEIYQYAYNETLARTERTYAGPQHPSYDIQLNGTGDLVLTDLSSPSASLRVAEEIQGRLFFRTYAGDLMAEVQKAGGDTLTIALPPGEYRVTLNQAAVTFESELRLRRGLPNRLSGDDFTPTSREYAIPRGDMAPPPQEQAVTTPVAQEIAVTTPLALTFVPGLSTAGRGASPVFSVGLIMASHDAVTGAMVSSVGSSVRTLRGAQVAGVFSVAELPSYGGQVSGVFNRAGGNFVGYQGSGVFNTIEGSAKGVQTAGIFNTAANAFDGIQYAGIFNEAGGDLRGGQVSGVFNIAGSVRGAQVSLVNIGGDVMGAQIGLINVGKTVYGSQIGLVNISEDIYGAPIGLVNLVENGITDASYWIEGDERVWVGLQNGSRHFYTLVYAGIQRDTELKQLAGLAAGAGIGARISMRPLYFDVDVSLRKTSEGETYEDRFFSLFHGGRGTLFPTARVLAGMAIGDGLGFFVGGTFDAVVPGVTAGVPGYHDGEAYYSLGAESEVLLYPKFVVGFKL